MQSKDIARTVVRASKAKDIKKLIIKLFKGDKATDPFDRYGNYREDAAVSMLESTFGPSFIHHPPLTALRGVAFNMRDEAMASVYGCLSTAY